jgi:signal transduction histidine kinase
MLLFTVPPLLALAFGALWMVNRSVSRNVQENVREDLKRASAVFEDMVAAHTRELAVAGQVIVQDPRFFSVLTLPGGPSDLDVRATVAGVANEFNQITNADLFLVVDAKNQTLSSVGRTSVRRASRATLVETALGGRQTTGVVVDENRHFLVSVTPVRAGGRIVGALLVGDGIGGDLAWKLRNLTRSEVSFVCGNTITGTTLGAGNEQRLVFAAVERIRSQRDGIGDSGRVIDVGEPGKGFLTIVSTIPGSDPTSDQYYVLQRSLEAETAVLARMQRGLVLLGILAALLGLGSSLWLAQRVTSPLRNLVRGAVEMERGNYDYSLSARSGDEVGYLTSRFLEMREHQRNYVRSLQDLAHVKSEFLSVASHELRTPISIVSCYHELMAGGQLGPVSLEQKEALRAIGESVVRLTRIAENATYMAQIDSERLVLRRSHHSVAPLLQRAIETARSVGHGRRVRLEVDIDPELEHVEVDGPQLTEAITQLVCNGIRFTPDGGTVTVSAHRDDDELVIAVADTGVGIPEEQRARIFERAVTIGDALHHHSSTQLDFNSAGLGLGLSIALGIVQAHEGTLRVESEVGRGSRFEIRVPIDAQDLRKAA